MFQVAIKNEHASHVIDKARMRRAVHLILREESMEEATISVAIVDDATICRLNREYLRQDRPTDVLSFVLDETLTTLDAEVIVSADTAAKAAARYGWTPDDELLLYVVHGTLHLMGYGDRKAEERALMRWREGLYLDFFGLSPHYSPVKSKRSPVKSKRSR